MEKQFATEIFRRREHITGTPIQERTKIGEHPPFDWINSANSDHNQIPHVLFEYHIKKIRHF